MSVLLAREALGSTGIGDGIAMPHVRNPIVLPVDAPIVSLCYLEEAVAVGAVDGKPVRTPLHARQRRPSAPTSAALAPRLPPPRPALPPAVGPAEREPARAGARDRDVARPLTAGALRSRCPPERRAVPAPRRAAGRGR